MTKKESVAGISGTTGGGADKVMMKRFFRKDRVIKSLKIALAAVLSIFIAEELGLRNSATAGIITVLSIQNTKRETLRSARNRGVAFLCALVLAAIVYQIFSFTLIAYAVFLFTFALLCQTAGWGEAIAMDSVLISHFLVEQSFSAALILNEIGIFIIGTTTGVLVNLHLRRKEAAFCRLADEVDNGMKAMLRQMAGWLLEERTEQRPDLFRLMSETLEQAQMCAVDNYNNAILSHSTYEIDYVRLREQQIAVLQGIYENIRSISYLPEQAALVAKLLLAMEKEYHRTNGVDSLLSQLDGLLADMEQAPLPASRKEFEARAILFYILKQIEELLVLKREFYVR